jgi:dTDP-4-dehydrorhamnose reductase
VAKLLITGAGGMLGANLVLDALAVGHQVIAVDYQHPVRHPQVRSASVDLSRPGSAQKLLAEHRPEWVIHCAAATEVDACEADPAMAFRLNRDMAGQVALAARAVDARLVHISTDAVFDGERGGYTEDDEPRPVNVYGESKQEGELAVRAEYPQALVVRTNIYGWNAQPKLSLAEWFLARLESGQECPGFTDAWFTPILVNDLADRLLQMLERGIEGLYHVAGRECITKFEFGRRLAERFGLDGDLVRPTGQGEAILRAKRGSRLCLDCGKAADRLGSPLPDVAQGLERYCQLAGGGRLAVLKSMHLTGEVTSKGGSAV